MKRILIFFDFIHLETMCLLKKRERGMVFDFFFFILLGGKQKRGGGGGEMESVKSMFQL